jgi:hypothetical protein
MPASPVLSEQSEQRPAFYVCEKSVERPGVRRARAAGIKVEPEKISRKRVRTFSIKLFDFNVKLGLDAEDILKDHPVEIPIPIPLIEPPLPPNTLNFFLKWGFGANLSFTSTGCPD